jgi:hypothetical protein
MAVRLQMNVGHVAGERRLPDSADTVSIVEPVIGSTSRTKGSLYLLVTGDGGRKLRDATKAVADRIREDYYYDLSAGISVCLRRAVNAANKALMHLPDRPVVEHGEPPPIGIALAVVRGNELYVATLGPAEAYLIRQARLLTLPDADPESGLPSEELDGPEVWHGEITMGDCLVLVSPNVTRRIGLGPLQDAVGQLHPQAAVDQIQRQFGSGGLGATGGDGMLIVEATEVASTHRASPLKPVWPNDALAGSPERSPIPLADTVIGGVAVVQSTAHQAQLAADGWLRRGVYSLFDRMPERTVRRGRVTPMIVRRERQQRAAVAVIGLLSVIAIVGTAMWFFAGPSQSEKVDTQVSSQQAFQKAQADVSSVYGSGRNLVATDPKTAYGYLKDAYQNLTFAHDHGYADSADVTSLLATVTSGLNIYYGVTMIQPQVVASWATDQLTAGVLGPDGAAYVLDNTVGTVYRVDLGSGTKLPMMWAGEPPTAGAGIVGHPRLLTTGGPDVLILDDFNTLWKMKPDQIDKAGRRTLIKINIPDNANWGVGSRAIGTFIVNPKLGQYNIYVAVPAMNQIMKYPPAADNSGYPSGDKAPYLLVTQDLSSVDDMYVDGNLYLLQNGQITRYETGGVVRTWSAKLPADTADKAQLLRTHKPVYTRIAADNGAQDQGTFYAYDSFNRRIIAIRKSDGLVVGDYMVGAGEPWLSDVRDLFVTTDIDGNNPVLYWIESGNLMSATLNPSGPTGASPGPSGSPKSTGSPPKASASPKVSVTPTPNGGN